MEASFWHARWETNRIGFHNTETHPLLKQHWRDVPVAPGACVLVPMCGKSLDLQWLSDPSPADPSQEVDRPEFPHAGRRVVGVELSEVAARDYFAERGESPTITSFQSGPHAFQIYQHQLTTIVVGDWFRVTASMLSDDALGKPAAVYDRAALVALPRDMRRTYAQHLDKLCGDVPLLLVTVEYDQSLRGGPPFPVFEPEVRELFSSRHCRKLAQIDSPLRDLVVQESAYLCSPS